MEPDADLLARLRAFSATAAFNRWCGLEITQAQAGSVKLTMPWRAELGQYTGLLHAGVQGALIDTACGAAAATLAGPVLATHYAVNCLRPAVGERFIAEARVVKPGRTQIFTTCELYAESAGQRTLVATGDTLLVPAPPPPGMA
ncbi:PaaI family thioesterase [Ideonella sp.]|uniref:PaaI family thioesterase n=1 Tax=Ideonella sp. TaxID=1929293 RepID=UPI0035B42E08